MKRGISVSILATVIALALPRQAFAWADEGHMTVAGFFRITGKKYFVLYRSQAKNISYSTDHRHGGSVIRHD
jgi:hypothetical protein